MLSEQRLGYRLTILGQILATLFCLLRSVTLFWGVVTPCPVGTGGEAIRRRLALEVSEKNDTLFHNIGRDCIYLSIDSLIDASVYTGPVVPDNGKEMAVSCP